MLAQGADETRRLGVVVVLALGCAASPGPTASEQPADPSTVASVQPPTPLPDVAPPEPTPTAAAAVDAEATATSTLHLPDVAGSGAGNPWSAEELARIRAVQPIVRAAAEEFGVDPNLINGLIWVESKFERKARGPAGAQGYMQIMPRTAKGVAKRLGERARPYDAGWNIRAGTWILSRNLERFEGDETLALAGYNRGTGTVAGWRERSEPIPDRTLAYVERVLRAKERFATAERAGTLLPAPSPAPDVAIRVPSGPGAG